MDIEDDGGPIPAKAWDRLAPLRYPRTLPNGDVQDPESGMMNLPERIYVERNPETNEKRWYSIRGMGEAYVRAETHDRMWQYLSTLQSAIEREGYEVLSNIDATEVSLRRKITD